MPPATEFLIAPWAAPSGVASMLVLGPAEEPLTLEEGKLRAGLDWPSGDPRDDLMLALIKAARQKVEADTGLALIEQTRRITITAATGCPMPIPPQALPLQSISASEGDDLPPEILDGAIEADYTGSFNVVAGWPDAATLALEAPLLVHAVGLLVAHLATLGRDLAVIEEPFLVPLGYEEAINPYRVLRIP